MSQIALFAELTSATHLGRKLQKLGMFVEPLGNEETLIPHTK